MDSKAASQKNTGALGLISRRIRLRSYQRDDIDALYRWHTDLEHLHLWTQDREILPYDRFVARFERRMKNRIDLFFTAEHIPSKTLVGFVYNYGSDSVDRTTYLTVFVDQQSKTRGFGIDVSILFLNYLFCHFGFRKVYSEVYAFNSHVVRIAEKAGFTIEGCLKEHRWWNGKFWDQYIYTITEHNFQSGLKRYLPYLTYKNR